MDAGLALRHRPSAGRRPGPGELHAALPGPHVRPAQRLRAARLRAGAVGRLAGLHPGRAASLRHRGDRARCSRRIVIPVALHRIVQRLGIHRTIETVVGIGLTMLAGIGLVALSIVVMLPVTVGCRSRSRARIWRFALSVVLLGLLMMVTRRNAVSQVVGFMSLENGLILAADRRQGHAARGRDQRRLLGPDRLHRHRHLPVPHPRALRHRRRAGARDVPGRAPMTELGSLAVVAVLVVPAAAAALLALLPGYRLSAARSTSLASLAHLPRGARRCSRRGPAAGQLSAGRRPQRRLHRAQHLRRLHHQRVQRQLHRPRARDRPARRRRYLRFYHAMYQALMFAMNLALVANNIGLMWVAIEVATLTTVLMVGIYRTARGARGGVEVLHPGQRRHRARAVRHDPRLSRGAAGGRRGLDAMAWSVLVTPGGRVRSGAAQPRLRVPAARLRHQGRAGAAARLAAGRPCRGPDADLGGAVGPAAQRRAVRAAALQDAARGQRRRARARPADDRPWAWSR